MPGGSRVRANNAYGSTTDNPLTAVASTFNSAELILLPAIASPTQHSVVVLDPKRVFGQPEIVIVTAHAGLSTSATVTRAAYGTIARSHPVGTVWAHVAVDEDYIEILTSTTRPTDPYVGQSIYETDTSSHRHFTGLSPAWQSSPPIGSLLAFLGAVAPAGYLIADGTAVSRTGITADLFAVIGVTYGIGDGVTTFNLPNLKGKVPVGLDAAQAEFDVLGELGGVKTVTLTAAQMPVHTHGVTDPTHNHSQNSHNHTQSFSDPGHNHGLSGGNHSHSMDGDYGLRFVISAGGAQNDQLARGDGLGGVQHNHGGPGINVDFGGVDVSFSDIDHENILSPLDGGTALSVNGSGTGISASNVASTATNIASGTGVTINNAGSGSSHENLQPYIVVNYIIKI